MKKSLFLAALAGIALASCVNEDFAPATPQYKMKFDAPVLKKQTTRADTLGEITGVKYPTNERFKVYCKQYQGDYTAGVWDLTNNNFFAANGEIAEHTNTADNYWGTVTPHFWPDAMYNLTFAAYSPAELGAACANSTITQTATGLTIEDFKTELVSDNQYDLMYASRVYDRNRANNGSTAVGLVFKHALSSISFSSQMNEDDYKNRNIRYKITKITLKGTFDIEADFNQGITGAIVDGNYVETEDPKWTNPAKNTVPEVTFAPSFEEFEVPYENPTQFTSGPSALLLIPQTIPTDAAVEISYDVTRHTGTTQASTLSASRTIPLKEFKQSNGSTIDTWEMSKRYVYRIAFGENKRIYFEPEITDWTKVETLIYTIQ